MKTFTNAFLILFFISLNAFGQSAEQSPCNDVFGEMIMTPENVSDPKYYSSLISKYDCDKKLQSKLLLYRAKVKRRNEDRMGAMEDITRSISILPSDFNYFYRGVLKGQLKDLRGAIADFDMALSHSTNRFSSVRSGDASEVFRTDILEMRGRCNFDLKHFNSARQDFNNIVEIDPNNRSGYLLRGMSNYMLREIDEACSDWSKAGELGTEKAFEYMQKFCQ